MVSCRLGALYDACYSIVVSTLNIVIEDANVSAVSVKYAREQQSNRDCREICGLVKDHFTTNSQSQLDCCSNHTSSCKSTTVQHKAGHTLYNYKDSRSPLC